jgi:hypothetical protein
MSLRPGPGARRALLALAAVLLVASGALAATRVLTITTGSAHPATAFKTFDGNPPKTFDIDGDGDEEILAQNDNNVLYVFDSRTGGLLAQLKSTYPTGWGARTFNGPEAYRDGGVTHVVQENSAAYVTSWRFDPAASNATRFAFVKEWERRMSDCFSGAGADSKPVLADLDRDGHLEILASTEESGIYALKADGSLYWKKCIGGGNGEPRPVDLNGDGWLDVVFASDGGIVTALPGRCTTTPPCSPPTMWSYSILAHFNLGSASVPVGAGFGQLDGAGGPDVVVGARDSHNATDWSQDHALLLALSSTGAVLWARQDATGNPLTYTHPAVVDADGDGVNEVYWGDWNTIGHKPPWNEADSWKTTGPAHFYRYSNTGALVWRQTLSTFWSNKDIAVADADGDGQQEALATGPNAQGHEGIWLLNVATGAKESFIDAYPWMVTRGPVLSDMWGTGKAQMVLEVGPQATTEGPAVHLYDLNVPFNALWPHLPSPPGVSTTTSTTTVPQPPFDATFTVKAPNEWWQELWVTASGHAITAAEVRVDGDVWQSMSKASWGAWTSSYHTVAGSKVEFLVHDSAGATSQSLPFTWMDGTLTKGSTTGSGTTSTTGTTTSATATSTATTTTSSSATSTSTTSSSTTTTASSTTTSTASTSSSGTSTAPTFGATFEVPPGVNEWWVEVKVTSVQTVVKVEASLDGGAWQDLPKTSWGTWAKSLHAPAGTQVTFRATSDNGAVAVSPPFSWLGGSTTTTSTTGTATTSGTASPLSATFDPHAVGNDWWVETAVSANHALAKVEASLNGGAWQDLPPTSWGTWAKSLNAPNGTQVTFRATDTAGATATSAAYTWT